jgi:hypothetical protein
LGILKKKQKKKPELFNGNTKPKMVIIFGFGSLSYAGSGIFHGSIS